MPSIGSSLGSVAVTGASGFVGAHVVRTLLERGYTVRGCVTDPSNPEKTAHLLAMSEAGYPGKLTLHGANLLDSGSYDAVLEGCVGLLHVGTAMGYAGANKPQEVYDGAVSGTHNVMDSVTLKRVIYTSSFAAVGHAAPPGYVFTEADWASDGRENDPLWSLENLNEKGETGYEMAKVETEMHLSQDAARTLSSRPRGPRPLHSALSQKGCFRLLCGLIGENLDRDPGRRGGSRWHCGIAVDFDSRMPSA